MSESIENIVLKILELAGFHDARVDVSSDDFFKIKRFNIQTENAGMLIGENGEHIKDLETVIRMFRPQLSDPNYRFVLDVNGYRLTQEAHIKTMAQETARKVIITKKPIMLEPMNAYERKIVHMELALHPDISTESEGERDERRVVIKPYKAQT